MLKRIDHFRKYDGFIGFECRDLLGTAVIGARKGMQEIALLMKEYSKRSFIKTDGSLDITTNTAKMTSFFKKKGLISNGKSQRVGHFFVFQQSIFFPNSIEMIFGIKPKKSFSIHHTFASWKGGRRRDIIGNLVHYLGGKARNALGIKRYARLRGIKSI